MFQRTPSSIDVRNNHAIDPEWFSTLGPGWQREWQMNFTTLQTGGFADEDLVKDGWTDIAQRIRDRIIVEMGNTTEFTPEMVAARVRGQRRREDDRDPRPGRRHRRRRRRRPTRSSRGTANSASGRASTTSTSQAYNEPGTHLVDTDGQGVERIDETGVWVAGIHYDLDCLVFASGFEVGTEYARRSGFETTGRDGKPLSEHWADGMRSLHGIHVDGFPNLFIVGPNQGANLISNITHNLVEAGTTIASVVAHAVEIGAERVEVTPAAEAAWMQLLEGSPQSAFLGNPDCTPGYYNNEGRPMGPRERFADERLPDRARSRTSSTSTGGATRATSKVSSSASRLRDRGQALERLFHARPVVGGAFLDTAHRLAEGLRRSPPR